MLTPILEEAVKAYDGKVILAKVNTEQEQELAAQFQIRGIPVVKAFLGGKQVSEFTGALPRHQVDSFIRGLLPSESDKFLGNAQDLMGQGNRSEARHWLERALGEDSRNPAALLMMGQLHFDNGQYDDAEPFLQRITAGGEMRHAADSLMARIDLARVVEVLDSPDLLMAGISANDENVRAHLDLGCWHLHLGDMEAGFEALLKAAASGEQAEEARHRMVQGFAILGPSHAVTRAYRSRLASLLF